MRSFGVKELGADGDPPGFGASEGRMVRHGLFVRSLPLA
jgi:hypothetical protein